jgi:hypothetical protein
VTIAACLVVVVDFSLVDRRSHEGIAKVLQCGLFVDEEEKNEGVEEKPYMPPRSSRCPTNAVRDGRRGKAG